MTTEKERGAHPFDELGDDGSIAIAGVGARILDTSRGGGTIDEALPRCYVRKSSEDGMSEALDEDDSATTFAGMDIIEPPLPLVQLVRAVEESNSLRQNIDAMSTNVDGFGFAIEFAIPLIGADALEYVADLLYDEGGGVAEPVAEAVAERLEKIKVAAHRERRKAKNFFRYCADESFIELRRRSRDDLEALGNFTWEVLRDRSGRVARFVHLPFYTMRLTKLGKPVDVKVRRKVNPITYEEFDEKRRFRRFVQSVNGQIRWFKEFGDPGFLSKKTGKYFESEAAAKTAARTDPDEGLATEVLHFKIPALRGPYGLPRWIGNILSVRGSRLAEEVNFFYFKNRAIPPLIIFVENGSLADSAVERLEAFFEEVKGDTSKYWKVAILEGESQETARRRGVGWTGTPRFKVVKLSSEQLKDALFQEYDEKNRDKVGESFRMPRLLRGDVRDFNRATAETAKSFAEEQVFQPERDRFDAWINRVVMPALEFRYVEFRSLAPIVRDPFSLTEMVEKLVRVGVLIPAEGRVIAADIFNREMETIDEEWVKRPIALTLAGRVEATPAASPAAAETETPEGGEGSETVAAPTLRRALGLGAPGEPIDVASVVSRLREIRNVFADLIADEPAGTVYAPVLDRDA